MTQTVCQTRGVQKTQELSQAIGGDTTIEAEAVAVGTTVLGDTPQQLVLWELDRQQVTVDFSAGSVGKTAKDPRSGPPRRMATTLPGL
jgi:hypothetical protein